MKRTAKILLSMTFTCFVLTACGGIPMSPDSAPRPDTSEEEAPANSVAVGQQPGYVSEDEHVDTAPDADEDGLTTPDADESDPADADSSADMAGSAGTVPGAETVPGASLDAVMDELRTEIDLSGTLSFSSQTAFGEAIDSSVFSGYDLTMINIWGTLCKPCIAEMSDLQKLYEDMADQGVNILGFVANYQEDRVEKAQAILTAKGVTYSNVVFDDEVSGAITAQISGFPTTIFVDSQGNVIGEQISGARSYDEYKDLIAERLEECASWQE